MNLKKEEKVIMRIICPKCFVKNLVIENEEELNYQKLHDPNIMIRTEELFCANCGEKLGIYRL